MLSNSFIRSTISQTGGGGAWVKTDHGEIRPLLNEGTDHGFSDRPGRYLYIYDHDSKNFWSANWQPTLHKLDFFHVRHGQWQSVVESSTHGINTTLTFQLATEEPNEVWQLEIGNATTTKRRLSLFFAADLAIDPKSVTGSFSHNTLRLTARDKDKSAMYFMALDKPVDSYDSDYQQFFGSLGDWSAPKAVKEGRCSRSLAYGSRPVAVLQKNLSLGAKTTTDLKVIVGGYFFRPTEKANAMRHLTSVINKLRQPKTIKDQGLDWQNTIEERRHRSMIQSPDETLNSLVNNWLKTQLVSASHWPVGSNQLPLSVAKQARLISCLLPYDAHQAERSLFQLVRLQYKEGRVLHRFLPGTGKVEERSDLTDNLELARALVSLVKETGQIDVLKTPLPYRDGGEGSLLEHLIRLTQFVVRHLEDHLVSVCQVQSTELTARLSLLLAEFCPILESVHEQHLSVKYQHLITEMKTSLNRRLWDGRWLARGRDHGSRMSVKTGPRAWDLASQIWPITANQMDPKKAVLLLKQIDRHPSRLANFWPAVIKDAPLPGTDGNASIDINVIIDLITAATVAGQADLAWQWLLQVSPVHRDEKERYLAEPFRLPASIYGPSHPRFGQVETMDNGLIAGRVDQLIRERIFGLQPVIGGLKIDPCLPSSWRQAEISRHWRGADYHVRFQNPFRGKAIDRIIVDGSRLTGNVIRPFHSGLHFVEVFLG